MQLQFLNISLSVLRLNHDDDIPDDIWNSSFLSITRTNDELSIVCEKSYCPSGKNVVSGYGLIKVVGPMEFNMTGILSKLLHPLAKAKLPVFTISTFDTDYILVEGKRLSEAKSILKDLPEVEIID